MRDEDGENKSKDGKVKKSSNFSFNSFIQALHVIASKGYDNVKDDITVRIPKLFKHIQQAMARAQASPSDNLKDKLRLYDNKDRNQILQKDTSDLYVTSGRSGTSTRSNRGKAKSNSQNRRSRKRKSSQRKRGRKMTNDRNTPGGLNNSFFTAGVNDSKNSLPALSAIYGNSFSNSNPFNKRNSSGMATIDINRKKKKGLNMEKVNQTLDVKMYEKNNSFTISGSGKTNKDFTSKKSPNGNKRNLSMGSHMTYDERKSTNFKTINPLDFETRMNLIKKSKMAQYSNVRNPRYRLKSLMGNKSKRSASRRKSSNSRKRAQKKINQHYRNKFHFKDKMRKNSEKKRQVQMRARLAKKLQGVQSADDYKNEEDDDLPTNEAADESCEYNIPEPGEKLDINQPTQKDEEEVTSNNPEDCKFTIFSGEGEILGTAGETQNYDEKVKQINTKKLTSEEMILHLQKENKSLKDHLRKILAAFGTLKHNHSINVEKESIKISK